MILDREAVDHARRGRSLRQRIEFALQPRDHPRIHGPRIDEHHEDAIPHRGLFVQVVNEPDRPLDPCVEDDRVEAIDDDNPRAALVEERRRSGTEVLQSSRVGGRDAAAQARNPKQVPAFRGGIDRTGRDPEERLAAVGKGPDERNREVFPILDEIAQAGLERKADGLLPLDALGKAVKDGPVPP